MLHPISNTSVIPPLNVMRSRFQSLAMLDAILMPDWELRYFSFNTKWGIDEMMASMRNGEGDGYFFLFCNGEVIGKIFCHDTPETETPRQILANVPSKFISFLNEAAFRLDEITCCLWYTIGNSKWEASPVMKGEIPLLAFVQDNGQYYRGWAEKYYEQMIPAAFVEMVFAHKPLTNQMLAKFLEKKAVKDLISDALEIGYPYVTD